MKYHYQISLHHRKRYLKRMYILVAITAVIGGLVILALRLDSYLQDKVNTSESTTTEQTSAYFASSNKVFTTEYFQIQAPKNWAAIPSESTDTMFVYRGINEPIVEDELIIYVNSIPASLTATRLLPVELSGGGQELSPGSVSEHCNEASEDDNIDTKVLTYKKVSINCDVDNTQFNVLVGAVGGSTRMNLNRPDGTVADYSILYRNIQAIPDASTIIQIMQSFQTR